MPNRLPRRAAPAHHYAPMPKRKSSGPARPRGVAPATVRAALVLLNLFIYAAVGRFELVNWDDPTYITDNPTVLRGLSWSTAWWALTTGHSPYWHPLTWLSHLLDVTLFGTDAGAYHVVNAILHTANTLLLFELLRRTTGATGRSAFVAAVFAAHPLHVESVAWVTERKDVLSTLCFLVTTLAYVGYTRRPSAARYAAVMALFALALMSKPMVVTLPVVLLLLDTWPLARPNLRGLIVEKVPLLALALATSVLTVVIQARVGAMAGLDALPAATRAANAAIGYVAYVWKTLWPSPLAAFYPLFDVSPVRVIAALAALGASTFAAFRLRSRHPYVWIGWLWYLVTITPVIGFLQAGEQGMADRFMYVPMTGLLIALAWGARPLLDWIGVRGEGALRAGAIAIVAACAIVARAQAAHWENSLTLWEHAARVTPDSYIAHENLGQALRERGRLDEARRSYERALALAPARSPAYAAVIRNSIGLVLTRQGRVGDAREQFAAAVERDPTFAEARSNFANALAAEGRPEAIDHYRAAIRLKPDYVEPRVGLGAVLLRAGRGADAAIEYRAAIALDPNLAQAHNGLGGALAIQGDDEGALREYREALRLNPALPSAHHNLALLSLKKGDAAGARRHLEAALAADPAYEPARRALAALASRS